MMKSAPIVALYPVVNRPEMYCDPDVTEKHEDFQEIAVATFRGAPDCGDLSSLRQTNQLRPI